jgi:mono/diheme cytochrome c family protein
MSKLALFSAAVLLASWPIVGQQASQQGGQQAGQAAEKSTQNLAAPIPVEAVQKPNPVRYTAESITRGKRQYGFDCAMCHGKEGNGKGDVAADMKLKVMDFTDPNTLKDRTDGELYYIIRKGQGDMPPEGDRVKSELDWDMVNYLRSLSKKAGEKPPAEEKQAEPKSPS